MIIMQDVTPADLDRYFAKAVEVVKELAANGVPIRINFLEFIAYCKRHGL